MIVMMMTLLLILILMIVIIIIIIIIIIMIHRIIHPLITLYKHCISDQKKVYVYTTGGM